MASGNSLLKLKVDSDEYDAKLKKAAEGIQHLVKRAHEMQGQFAGLEKNELEFIKNLGNMYTVSKTASGQLRELETAYKNLAATYEGLSTFEKQGDAGKALCEQLDILKKKVIEAKSNMDAATQSLQEDKAATEGLEKSSVDLGSVLSSVGGQFGVNTRILSGLTSGTIATTAAVTAGAAAVAAATKMWADYNDELNRQTSMTKVVTGLDGSEAEDMVVSVRALAKTYDVDFRQAIDTANTLMHQFGLSGEESIQLLRAGMQGMIAGDGPKLLSMIQQFAPAFVDAGISADKLVAIIHNSEGGLFSEQNMNAILMGIKNIRLMTKATSDALAQMGIDGEEMSRKMSDGSMTVFEALQQVAEALEKANAGSREAGQVMQSVFGRQGAMQGMKLARAIAELNTNLEETKTQTGELGQSFIKLNQANELLENTMRETFGVKGWEDMSNQLKTDLALALADIVKWLGDVKTAITEIGTEKGFDALADALRNSVIPGLMAVGSGLKEIKGLIADIAGWNNNTSMGDRISNFRSQYDELKKMFGDGLKVEVKEVDGKVVSAHKWVQGKKVDITEDYLKREAERNQQQQPPKNNNDNKPVRTPKVKTQQTEEQLNTAKIQAYQQEYITASDERKAVIRDEIKTLQDRNKEIQRLKDEAAGKVVVPIEYPKGSLPKLEKEMADLQKSQKQALDNNEWKTYQQAIDETTRKIALLKGELPNGEQATFTIDVNKAQLEELRNGGLFGDKSIRVNVEQGEVDLPDIPKDETYTLTIAADTTAAMEKVNELVQNIEHQQPVIKPKVEMPTSIEDMKINISDQLTAAAAKIDTNTLTSFLKVAVQNGITDLDPDFSELMEKIKLGDIPDATWQTLQDEINAKLEELGIEPIKIDFKTGNIKEIAKDAKKVDDGFRSAMDSVQNLGSALNNLEDPGAKVAGTVAQAIAQIALGFAQATATTGTGGIFAWIAAITGGLATMTSTISAIHNATGYAKGGKVEGPAGIDAVPAWLTAGEIVLSAAMQNNLASALQSERPALSGLHLETRISAEDIRLVLNNRGKRTGRGEYVQGI